jgi:hypothetical protein
MSKEVLFSNCTLTNQGYIGDSTYQIILEGNVKKEYKIDKPNTFFIILGAVAAKGVIYFMYKGSRLVCYYY